MNENQLSLLGDDPFLAHGQANLSVQGQYLSFNKGEWLYGVDTALMPLGTKFAVNMPSYRRGWKRWQDRKVTREEMVLLVARQPGYTREALGDLDRRLWEVDPVTRNERDPWAETEEVQLTSSEGELFIYGASSKGGLNCLRRLCVDYGKARRMHEGQVPVVELGRDSYEHKVYGRTYVPVLSIVDWVGEETLAIDGPSGNGAEAVEDDDIPFEGSSTPVELDTLAANASAPTIAKQVTLPATATSDEVGKAFVKTARQPTGLTQVLNEKQAEAERLRLTGIAAKKAADAALAALAAGKGSEKDAAAALQAATLEANREIPKPKRATRF